MSMSNILYLVEARVFNKKLEARIKQLRYDIVHVDGEAGDQWLDINKAFDRTHGDVADAVRDIERAIDKTRGMRSDVDSTLWRGAHKELMAKMDGALDILLALETVYDRSNEFMNADIEH